MTQYQYQYQYSSHPRITQAVQRLIFLCIIVFVLQLVADVVTLPFTIFALRGSAPGGLMVNLLAFKGTFFLSGAVWTPLTYIFLHAGLMHLFMNMLWLFFFGPDVERVLGTRQFYRFFLVCGAVGVLATLVAVLPGALAGGATWAGLWSALEQAPPVVGASGAVMGVLIAFAMTNPEREFYLIPLPVPINARALVVIVVLLNVFSAVGGTNTSVATHFGGMLTGYAYMKLAPAVRRWWDSGRGGPGGGKDPVGDAVNNLFRFEEERRKRR